MTKQSKQSKQVESTNFESNTIDSKDALNQVKKERIALQVDFLLKSYSDVLDQFKISKSTLVPLKYGKAEYSYGYSMTYSALGFKSNGINIFEVEKLTKRDLGFIGGCEKGYGLVAIGVENAIGQFVFQYNLELRGDAHSENYCNVPRILDIYPEVLKTSDETQIEFIPKPSSEIQSFTLKLREIDQERRSFINKLIGNIIKIWPEIQKYKLALQLNQKRADEEASLQNEIAAEAGKLEQLKALLKR